MESYRVGAELVPALAQLCSISISIINRRGIIMFFDTQALLARFA
jgi:hypothetical protein